MILGSAWYPEHWPEERWERDLQLMRGAGFNMVRVAEFAWSRLEPEEGHFDFDWLERAIDQAASFGLPSVLGTPTAAPPAWLTQRYPETLAVRQDGRPATHGMRCHYSPTSPRYRDFCRRIAAEMAKRFGRHPHVIGWQIDNEYNSVSYDDEARRQFQDWLRQQYGTLESLNSHWTTSYWSQEYTDWSQIPFPVGNHNPGLVLAFRRFVTHVYRTFQYEQISAIRAHAAPEHWITHNFMGWFDAYDHYELSADLDFASWDNYVGTGHLDYLSNGAVHDLTRGFKRKNFWLMETQPGNVNWSTVNNALHRDEVRAMAWHAVGHGADCISYWQWRSALGGQEQYHGTLIAPDGEPRPLYHEVAQLGREFAQVAELLRDTTLAPQSAILHSYDDRWAINAQRHHHEFDPTKHLLAYYRPLRALTHELDIVHPQAPLESYRLVVAPHLHLLSKQQVEHLVDFVENGGHLVLGARSGMKDEHNALLPARQPGGLASLLCGHVEEYYSLEEPIPVEGTLGNGTARLWAEWLVHDQADVDVLLRYGPSNGWLDGQAAVITCPIGEGRITYAGAWLDSTLMAAFADWLVQTSGVEIPFVPVPEGVEVCRRTGANGDVFVVINHTAQEHEIALNATYRDVLRDEAWQDTLVLAPRDVAVLVAA